jgi:hypothetical protein
MPFAVLPTFALCALPLPPAPWAVAGDGATCSPVDAATLEELSAWREDPENTLPDEGVFGRVALTDPNRMVLLFASQEICERMLRALMEEQRANRPAVVQTEATVLGWLEERLRGEAPLRAAWAKLSEAEQRELRAESVVLFAGEASRLKAQRRLDAAAQLSKGKKANDASRAREIAAVALPLWRELFARVFGAPWAPSVIEK